ncbi:MAG TPA: FAD-dependent oxidoreductase [Bacteroidales bacterium]|nr:FAD-dependent oxidoreductase [Bacteroidales bacterium]
MRKQVQITLSPADAADENKLKGSAANAAGVERNAITGLRIIRRSVDARHTGIKVNITAEISTGDDDLAHEIPPFRIRNVSSSPEIIIIGAGPAGLFAALRLIELGYKPVLLERGKDVSSRKRDIARISREQIIDPDSNYCFGEGGAGTFSDGKLYTRSKKRGDNIRVLELLCLHGAGGNILYEAHPHLGTDKLPGIISKIRETVRDAGGDILFGKKVTDLVISNDRIEGVKVRGGETFRSGSVILATGHSSRDMYEILFRNGAELERKAFAAGVRVEHPQELIDRIQYHGNRRGEYLPAASYNLVRQVGDRGVYSFCMCPGGFIVPSATIQEEVVVNGMSPSGRNSPFANSGIVVELRPEDYGGMPEANVLSGLAYQEGLEHLAWINGGRAQTSPAQRLDDFVNGHFSSTLPRSSYFPGIVSSPVHEWMPDFISSRLREGFRQFGLIMKGYLTNDAIVTAVESRTSSPVRIPRDSLSLCHVRIKGLYPCGEGSGYAGGIVSSAVDGMRAAEAVAMKV